MDLKQIIATGVFLQFYSSDLSYILNFQRFKINENIEQQLCKEPGTLKSFLDEFRVARNFKKEKTSKLFELTLKWAKRSNCDDVDGFAKYLMQHHVTDGSLPLSLASKILFLNNPWEILPLDSRAKNAVGLKTNSYSSYLSLVANFRKENAKLINTNLAYLQQYFLEVEKDFKKPLFKIEIIRENRFIDKLLWTLGNR
jgi:hypothetical protein